MHILAAAAIFLSLTTISAIAEMSDNVIRLGVLNDQSGVTADWAGLGSVEAARMAVEDAGGSINGTPIQVIAADHQNKPDLALSIARRWYDLEKVDAIVDVPHSAISQAVQQLARERSRAVLFATTTNDTLTNENCGPTTVQWVWDTYAVSNVLGKAMSEGVGQKWFFLTMDLSFGHQILDLTSKVIEPLGGKIVGAVRHPLGTADYASFLLQAQGSNADVIAVASAGADQVQLFKQAAEFGLLSGKTKFAGMLVTIADVHGIGLEKLQGAYFPTAFYWDMDDETRAFSTRFAKRMGGRMPTMVQAGVYSVVAHYLKAAKELNSDDSLAVVRQMKSMPVNDFMTKDTRIREDGRLPRDLYLVQVKSPSESRGPWDYYNIVRRVPGAETVRPLSESKCSLLQHPK